MMGRQLYLMFSAALVAALTTVGCGQSNVGDPAPPGPVPSTSPNGFLLFPNPQRQPDGSLQTDSISYARAYYAAIDPNSDKDTLAKWKAANGFGSGTGTQAEVVFGDVRDLGYGRRLTARQNDDGTVAVLVDNYLVSPNGDYAYGRLNLDAAVVQDPAWHIGTSAIEFSPGPAGGASFAKFFFFNPGNGGRALSIDADGRGNKAVPSLCISCHGGRADPLTPPAAGGAPLFPLVRFAASQQRGDVQGRLMPLEVGTFDFSADFRYARASQESAFKAINRMILCTYPLPAGSQSTLPEDTCRRVGTSSEYAGTAAEFLKAAYGGDGMPNAAYADTFLPAGWSTAEHSGLYQSVVAPYCRGCHLVRGTASQSDIDFNTFDKFAGFADRNKAHVIDRGNMPLAHLLFEAFWGGTAPEALATHLGGLGFTVRDERGAVLKPGRPVADPGPDRVVSQGDTPLSADGSQFAGTYSWSIVSGPDGAVPASNATLTGADTAHPVFNASADGIYVLQLVAGSGGTQSAPAPLRLVVNGTLTPVPSMIRFSAIRDHLLANCGRACHRPGGVPPVLSPDFDRNGDTVVDTTDDAWYYAELRGLINFTDIVASPLLRKPAGNHHGGRTRTGFDTSATPGASARSGYDLYLNWAINGAPQ